MTDKKKKMWALISSGLMVAFMIPTAVSSYSKNRDVVIGYAGSSKVSASDLADARSQWDLLRRLTKRVQDPETQAEQEVSFLQDFFARQFGSQQQGGQVADQIINTLEQSREAFYLLLREAEEAGTPVSEDEIRNLETNVIGHPDELGSYDVRVHQALRSLLAISNTAHRAAAVLKTSTPERDLLLSRQQMLGLNLVEFKAADYLSAVPQWSDADKAAKVQSQYDKYKNAPPTTQPGNEFGFGYLVPNQVRVQYIELRADDLRKAVGPQIEEKDLWKYYITKRMDAHPAPFGTKPPPTVAAPTTLPAATLPAATQPAVPAIFSERVKPFREAREEILKQLTDERMSKLATDVFADINTQLNGDYAAFKAAMASAVGGPTTATSLPSAALAKAPATALGVSYDSYEYLQKLALREQQKFNVLPVTYQTYDLRSAKQLADDSSIAKSSLPGYDLFTLLQRLRDYRTAMELNRQIAPLVSFPIYASNFVQPLAAVSPGAQQAAARFRLRILGLYEPSPIFREGAGEVSLEASSGAGRNQFIFRVAQAVPAHAPPLDDVRDKVLADVRLAEAYQLARQAADKFVVDARNNQLTLESAAAIATPSTAPATTKPATAAKRVITTGLFETTSSQIPGYTLPTDPATVQIFATSAFSLLSGFTRDNPHPLGLLDCQPTGTAFAAEINQLVPRWTADTFASEQLFTTARVSYQRGADLRAQWYDLGDIMARSHYRPADTGKSSSSSSRQPPPSDQQLPSQNPFTP